MILTNCTADRKRMALDRTLFDVDVIDGRVVDTTNDRVISEVSDRYTLVSNRSVIEPFVDTFGIDSLQSIRQYGAGRNYVYELLTGRELEITEGDVVKERIIVRNSYDKSKSFMIIFGAFRLLCLNGLWYGVMQSQYKKIHVGEIPVSQIVDNVLSSYNSNNFDLWRDFAKRPMSLEEEHELLQDFKAFEEDEVDKHTNYRNTYFEPKDSRYLNRRIREIGSQLVSKSETKDNARSAWGLYNCINRAVTLVYELQGDRAYQKRVTANVRAEGYLKDRLSL